MTLYSSLILTSLLIAQNTLHAGPQPVLEKQPVPVESEWQIKLGIPAWIAGVRGDSGLNGATSHSNTGFTELVNKIDMLGSFRAEISKGRFGVLADFSYTSLSGSIGTDGVIRKLDFREDEMQGDLGLRWRLIDSSRGSLDIIGGVRYTYLYTEVGLQSNDEVISDVADELAAAGAAVRARVARELVDLDKSDQTLGTTPLAANEKEGLGRGVERIKDNTASRADKIEKRLHKGLNRRFNRTDQWLDPYIGLRARYNFNDKAYFLSKADISPFDVGADFAWQASAGFGCQLSPRVYCELVYRILDVDYRHDGLIYDNTSYGPELTLGVNF